MLALGEGSQHAPQLRKQGSDAVVVDDIVTATGYLLLRHLCGYPAGSLLHANAVPLHYSSQPGL